MAKPKAKVRKRGNKQGYKVYLQPGSTETVPRRTKYRQRKM